MFSDRTNWNTRPTTLATLLHEKQQRGEDIIDLTESNPTRCGFQYNTQGMFDALATRRSLLYEPNPKGLPLARTAIADWYSHQGVTVSAEHLFLTTSTSEGYSFLFRLLCNAGDSVLTPKPSYPLLDYLCQLNDIVPQYYSLMYDGEWRIDFERLETSITKKTRAIILIHPNNPTGSFIKQHEQLQIEKLARQHNIPLIVDEVFSSFGFEQDQRRVSSFANGETVLTFTLNGLSKLAGLPQMKIAWIAVGGPEAEREEALKRLEIITDTYLSVATPVQQALPSLLKDSFSLTQQILERIRGNYQWLASTLGSGSAMSMLRCEGGWSAVIQLPNTRSDEEWALTFLRERSVLVHPGHLFDLQTSVYIVISLLIKREMLESGIEAIKGVVEV